MGSDISLSKAVRANLLSLQNTAEMMNKTQNRLATGNKVNSALDNPSNFFTASALNSRAADMSNLLDSMASGIKVIEAANNGITALTKNLESMQSTLRQARQDKSFQTQSFEVTDNTVINLSGGQFDAGVSLKLADAEAKAGVKASLGTIGSTAYLGPQSTSASADGAGPRTLLTNGGGLTTGDEFTVAGITVTAGADVTDAGLATTIQTALDADLSTAGKFNVTAGAVGSPNAGKIVIETIDTAGSAAAVTFGTGSTAAVKGATTFNFADVPANVTIGSQTIASGANYDEFVANLKAGEEAGGYVVTTDADKNITLTNKAYGGTAPAVTGVAANAAAITSFDLDLTAAGTFNVAGQTVTLNGAGSAGTASSANYQIDLNGVAPTTISIGGADVTIPAFDTDAATSAGNAVAAINADLAGRTPPVAYTAAVSSTGVLTLTSNTNDGSVPPAVAVGVGGTPQTPAAIGSAVTGTAAVAAETNITAAGKITAALAAAGVTGYTAAVAAGGAATITSTTAGPGSAVAVSGAAAGDVEMAAGKGTTTTAVVTGASTSEVAAGKDEFSVSYDGKTADIKVGGLKIGASALDRVNWQNDTVASIKSQLEAKGINGVTAEFDDAGNLSIVAKEAEAKTIAISGKDATTLFGADTVSTGSATETGLNATKTTDKFVELINKKFGSQVRASNDNGKLRIENLSTQDLSIGVDANGNGAINPLKVEGNTVRANLSKQFNELRDQLDKLSDDASFNGINLLRGDKLKITFNESGTSSIDIQAKDKDGNVRGINASNLNIDTLVAEDLDTDEAIDAFLGKLSSALTELRTQASSFGSNLSSVENRQSFTKNMINTLETGAANLTLADTNEEAANLLALQTRQQLSSSALSMASQQDQAVLQLLR